MNKIWFLTLIACIASSAVARADALYFDVNSDVAGSGVGGNTTYTDWNTQDYWSVTPDGTGPTGLWVDGSDAVFSAGNDAEGVFFLIDAGFLATVNSVTAKANTAIVVNGTSDFQAITLTTGNIHVESGFIEFDNIIKGSNGLTKTGPGELDFNGRAAEYTGDTTIMDGLVFMGDSRLPTNSRLVMEGSAIFNNDAANTAAGLSGSGGTIFSNGFARASTLTLSKESGSETFGGVIAHGDKGLRLIKDGAYTQRLTGANTYRGPTTITAGKLIVNGSSAAESAVTIKATGGILAGTGTINGAVTSEAGSKLAPGDEGGTLTLTKGLKLATSGGSLLEFGLGSLTSSLVINAGAFAVNTSGTTTIDLIDLGGISPGPKTLIDWTGASTPTAITLAQFALGSVSPTLAGGSLAISGTKLTYTIPGAVGVPGDYSGNGMVDAADYTIWRDRLGQSYQLPNEVAGTTPGQVTVDDYNAWKSRFGNTSGSGSFAGGANVPEPSTILSVVIALSACGSIRWRKSAR
jgi:autotransporter-associated beta strand protein